MLKTPEFWVAMSFLGFVALLLYYKVPSLIGKALDARADAIRNELDEARKLRTEAQAILDDYKRKQSEAQKEAEQIVASARREAEALAAESRRNLKEALERRTRVAEEKIARAEAQALADVRSASVDASVAAAQKLIGARMTATSADTLIDRSIKELGGKLN
jgi:F-type H+-transporting ATPase subunit b